MPVSLDDITGSIINSAIGLHRKFQNGLLESAYELMMANELRQIGFEVQRQHQVTFIYENTEFKNAFRVDLLVNQCVVVEIKSIHQVKAIHRQQLLTYLRLMNLHVGLLVNFGAERLTDGLHRVVNKLSLIPCNRRSCA